MDRRYALRNLKVCALLASISMATPKAVQAQLNLAAVNTAYTINFDGTVSGVSNGAFTATGFQPAPTAGRLDSDAWATTGWSDGSLAYGGTQITSGTDFRRGTTAPGDLPIAVGGIWSFGGTGITGRALGFQQTLTDANPGTMTLRVQNNTGSTLTSFDVSYNAYYRNDQDQSSFFNLRYSEDNVSYFPVSSQDLITPAAQTGTSWVANARSTTISGVVIPNGAYFYIRWAPGTVGGSGSWDELALDDISVTGRAFTAVRLTSTTTTIGETGGTTSITASITNPDLVNATSVDLVLTSGPAARVGNYTTQTLTFPGGSSANQSQTITITDNGDCDGNATLVFDLQNIIGGLGTPSIARPFTHTITVVDDETGPAPTIKQAFDGAISDDWPITSGGGNISTTPGVSDVPANQRIYNGARSWQVRNANVTLNMGAADIQDWSGITLSARLSSTSTTAFGGADANDSVAFYVSLNGGPFPLDPDVRVNGNSNGRWGYGAAQIATGVAGTPVNYTGNLAGNFYSQVRITIPDGTSSVALRIVARNNDNTEIWNIDDVQINGTLCSRVYYSRANGDETTPTWSTARTGSPLPAAVAFNKNKSMVVQNTHSVNTTGANFSVRDLIVETGGSMALGGTTTLGVNGTALTLDGPLTSADDHIRLLGNGVCNISGASGTLGLADLTVNGGGAVVNIATINVSGTLLVTKGNFNANGNLVALRSTSSGTARLGPVGTSASYSGDLLMERYIPAGVTDWRLLACPMQGRTFWGWKDDFYTAGFPGSHYPNFFQNNVLWPSIRKYDETNLGTLSTDGLVGIGNVSDLITEGRGFAAWSGDNFFTTAAFTIDVKGPPTVAATPFTLPMTYTNTGTPAVDGLNLVGNPVPSPIDFSLVALGADVDDYYYIYDPGSGTNATWDEANSLGTLGANGNIQSSQGFWLHATGSNVTTTVSESAKVLEPINGGIFSLQMETRPLVRLKLTSVGSSYADEAIVHFINGAPDQGAYDIAKFGFVHPSAVSISTLTTDGQEMTINAYGTQTAAVDVPVQVDVQVDGDFVITAEDLTVLTGMACVALEDLVTGITTPLVEGASYTFSLGANDPVSPARFVLHVGAPVERSKTDVSCNGQSDGTVTLSGAGAGPWDYVLADAFGTVLDQVVGATAAHTFSGLAAGSYTTTVDGGTGCGALTAPLLVDVPAPLELAVTSEATGCALSADGSLTGEVLGGTAPMSYLWSNGAATAEATGLVTGSYALTVTDANGCVDQLSGLVVAEGTGPVASFDAVPALVLVNEPVDLFNNSTYGLSYTWDFGDGNGSTENEPVHVYALPGLYTVTLTVEDGDCSAVLTQDVAVSTSTSVVEQTVTGLAAWSDGSQFIVQWQVEGASAIQADVLDATGKTVMQGQARGNAGRMTMDAQSLPAGIYFLRLISGSQQRTFRLPVVR